MWQSRFNVKWVLKLKLKLSLLCRFCNDKIQLEFCPRRTVIYREEISFQEKFSFSVLHSKYAYIQPAIHYFM